VVCNYPASGELGQYVEKGREKKRKEVSGEAGERQKKRVLLKVVRELEKERYGEVRERCGNVSEDEGEEESPGLLSSWIAKAKSLFG